MTFLPFQRKTFFLILTVLLIIFLPLFIFIIQKNQENRSHANAGTTLVLSNTSAKQSLTVNDPITLTLTANPGTTNILSIVSFVITYDTTKVSPTSSPFTLNPALAGWKVVTPPQVNPTTGTISGTYSVGTDPTQAIQRTTPFGTFSFTAIAGTEGQTTTIGFANTSSVYSLGSSETANENVLASTTPVSFSIASSVLPTATPAPGGQVCLEVITTAVNDTTGVCQEFPTSCLPAGWHSVTSCPVISPTSSLTPTTLPTLIPTSTTAPTPTVAASTTFLSLNLGLHGIGYAGDSASPGRQVAFSVTNPVPSDAPAKPLHLERSANVAFYDQNNEVVYVLPVQLTFNDSTYTFTATVPLGPQVEQFVTPGNYNIRISLDQYLTAIIPLASIKQGQTNVLPYTPMIAGNVYNDDTNQNQLDILDYNTIMDCREDVDAVNKTGACSFPSDLNDDGHIDVLDYNLFIRELSIQNGR